MLNEKEEKIMQLIRTSGPVLPIMIAKHIGIDSYLAGAMLSSLVKNNHIKISQRKVGSSPLYYIDGQESRVRAKLHTELNDLEKKALERMRELKVAFEEDLYPQERFLLNELKDFVTPLKIKAGDKEISCWKHHSISTQELNEVIDNRLNPPKKEPKVKRFEPKIEQQMPLKPPEHEDPPTKMLQQQLTKEKPRLRKRIKREIKISDFESKVLGFFKENKMAISERKQLRKGDVIYNLAEESPLGKHQFLVNIKDKKRLSEHDISKFYITCQNKKMPGLLFTSKEPSTKIKNYIEKHIGNWIKIVVI